MFAKVVKKWNGWTDATTNRRIFGATVVIAALTFIVKLVSTLKEIAVAGSFGMGDDLDAYLIAILVPSYVINVIGGSFKAALIPTYIQVREKDGIAPAQKLFSNTMAWSLAFLLLTTIPMIVAAPHYLPIIASGFPPEKIALTCRLLYFLSPIVVLAGLNSIWGAVLNADRRFGLVAISPVITPLIVLTFLLLGFKQFGISSLAFGTVCGIIFELSVIGLALKRRGISLWPRWYGLDPVLRQVIKQFVPMFSGAILMCSTDFISQSMAAMLGPGSVSSLNYANKIVTVPLSLTAMALGTAVIPYFSTMTAQRDWTGIRNTLKRYFSLLFIVSIPATIILIMSSETLVRLLYQRGSFGAEDTSLVSRILSLYALQIPFYLTGILMVRLLSAMLANHILMIGNFISLAVCISLNYYFMKIMGIGGIALSTSCVYLVSFIFQYFSWRRMSKDAV